MLGLMAQAAAKRHGFADHEPILRRARAAIGVRIWKRLAAMVIACLPRLSRDELVLFQGRNVVDGAGDVGDGDDM